MIAKEKLYSDVPPTQLRGKEEKFKPAKTNKFWLTVASLFFFNMLQNRFYAFRYNGYENGKPSIRQVYTDSDLDDLIKRTNITSYANLGTKYTANK